MAHGVGNQDVVGGATLPSMTIAALADGHSDPRCMRAAVGAALAVESGTAAASSESPLQELPALVVRTWRRLVSADAAERPDDEPGTRTMLAYGTTLLLSRWTPAGLELLRVGDGDVVVIDEHGVAARTLLPAPLPSGETDSLSDGAAIDLFHWERCGPMALGIVLSSDGVDAAYPSERGLLDAVETLYALHLDAEQGVVEETMTRWVAEAAATSGDDASVVAMFRTAGSDSW